MHSVCKPLVAYGIAGEAVRIARERKTYDEPQVDAEVLEQGLVVKTDEVPTALEAAERKLAEGSEQNRARGVPQPELAPRRSVGAIVTRRWMEGWAQPFPPVARRRSK
jgi:hypothetical protein